MIVLNFRRLVAPAMQTPDQRVSGNPIRREALSISRIRARCKLRIPTDMHVPVLVRWYYIQC